jgi:hypothetical protein
MSTAGINEGKILDGRNPSLRPLRWKLALAVVRC